MGYRSLAECVDRLWSASGQLVRIEAAGGCPSGGGHHPPPRGSGRRGRPSCLPTLKVVGFPMVSNLFGTMERMRLMFRDGLGRRCSS